MGANGRPFRFGVTVRSASSRDDWISIARKAEELGFSVLAMPDHLGDGRFAIAPGVVLAAEATRRLRVGSFVYANDFRNPVFLAQEVATIDRLTGGRFEFGLGAGWLLTDYEQSGLDFDSAGVRVSRMQEALGLIRRLLTEPSVTFSGSHYRVKDAQGFQATQLPHPPFLVGGGGQRILSFAAREASIISVLPRSRLDGQGFNVADASAEAFDQKIRWIREAAGERFAQLELNVLLQAVIPTNERLEAASMLAQQFKVPAEGVLTTPLVLIGPADQMVEDLEARRDRYGISYITVFDRDMEAAAPLVSRLTGR